MYIGIQSHSSQYISQKFTVKGAFHTQYTLGTQPLKARVFWLGKEQTRARTEERNKAPGASSTFYWLSARPRSTQVNRAWEAFSQSRAGRALSPKEGAPLGVNWCFQSNQGQTDMGHKVKLWRLSTKYLSGDGPRVVLPWPQDLRGHTGTRERWPEGNSLGAVAEGRQRKGA